MARVLQNQLVILGLTLLGCGSDGGGNKAPSAAALVGTYEVTSHTLNTASCDSEGDMVSDFSHFEIRQGESFFGVASLELFECQDASTCEMDLSSMSWFQDISSWKLESTYASGSGDLCSVGKNLSQLQPTENGVRAEQRRWSGSISLDPGQDCLDQDANDYLDMLDCELEVLEGDKL